MYVHFWDVLVDRLHGYCCLPEDTAIITNAHNLGQPPTTQGLDLVFVAVYQKALKLLYVEDLLKIVKRDFAQRFEQHGVHYDYAPEYTDIFKAHIKRLEQHAETLSKANAQRAQQPKERIQVCSFFGGVLILTMKVRIACAPPSHPQGTAQTAATNGKQENTDDDDDDDGTGVDQPSSEASAADGNDTQQSTTDEVGVCVCVLDVVLLYIVYCLRCLLMVGKGWVVVHHGMGCCSPWDGCCRPSSECPTHTHNKQHPVCSQPPRMKTQPMPTQRITHSTLTL